MRSAVEKNKTSINQCTIPLSQKPQFVRLIFRTVLSSSFEATLGITETVVQAAESQRPALHPVLVQTFCMVLGKLFHLSLLLFPLPSCLFCIVWTVNFQDRHSFCVYSQWKAKPSLSSAAAPAHCYNIMQILAHIIGINTVYRT